MHRAHGSKPRILGLERKSPSQPSSTENFQMSTILRGAGFWYMTRMPQIRRPFGTMREQKESCRDLSSTLFIASLLGTVVTVRGLFAFLQSHCALYSELDGSGWISRRQEQMTNSRASQWWVQWAINEANWQVSLSYSVQFELEDRSIHIYECCDTELDRHNPSGIEADVRIDPRMRFYMFCRCPTHFLSPLQRYTAL